MTIAGVTIREGGMESSERRRYAQETGRPAPRLSILPRGHVIPAKAGTYWMASAYAKAGTYWMASAYAKAGTYPIAPRPHRSPDCSTLSRRVRGVLSPYRERGNSALARPSCGAGFPPTRE